jgi:hypothetical protein
VKNFGSVFVKWIGVNHLDELDGLNLLGLNVSLLQNSQPLMFELSDTENNIFENCWMWQFKNACRLAHGRRLLVISQQYLVQIVK